MERFLILWVGYNQDIKKLKSIKLGSKVTGIGKYAFGECKSLKSITLGNKVTTIGDSAFYDCKNLKTLIIKSKKLKTVDKNAFKGCKNTVVKAPAKYSTKYQKMVKKAGLKKGKFKKI